MIALNFAIVLSAVLVFLLGKWFGALMHESQMRQRIKDTGFFMLDDGFYKAIEVRIDTSKHRPIIRPEELADADSPPETLPEKLPENHLKTLESIDAIIAPVAPVEEEPTEPSKPKRTIRRRAAPQH